MDAERVAAVLDRLWAVRAGPRPKDRTLRLVRGYRPGWPGRSGAAVDAGAVPVLWAASLPDGPVQYVTVSPAQHPDRPVGLRRLAEHPVTTNRVNLVLADHAVDAVSAAAAGGPLRAHRLVVFALTAGSVADALDDRAALDGAPARQLRKEAGSYRAEAEAAAAGLPAATASWWDDALTEIDAAAGPPATPTQPRYRTVPGQLKL